MGVSQVSAQREDMACDLVTITATRFQCSDSERMPEVMDPRTGTTRHRSIPFRAETCSGTSRLLRNLVSRMSRPSVLKPLIATVDKRLVLRKLGGLNKEDRQMLRKVLDAILGR